MSGETPPVEGPWPDPGGDEIRPGQQRALVQEVEAITAATREYLPDSFQVHSDVTAGQSGPQVALEVHPPVGPPLSAGVTPAVTEGDHAAFSPDEREELARRLAASAAVQLRQIVGDSMTPPAR